MRILVIGGYGNFGARICRALADTGTEVIACGRNPRKSHSGMAFDDRIGSAYLDIAHPDFPAYLAHLHPYIVINCAGPFQGQDYRVAFAALAAGSHYIDLADSRMFVHNFAAAVDPGAREKGLLAVTGASTLPALSSAVIDYFRQDIRKIDEIQISIAPAQRSPRGVATLRAVFSYLGKPFKWLEAGKWKDVYGWQGLKHLHFSELGKRWAAACDVPDLELFPVRYPDAETIQFRAALEFGIEHFLLAAIASMRRMGIPLPVESWAGVMDRIATVFNRFGGMYGGMLVRIAGLRNDGKRICAEWHLTADSQRGPDIPCIPAILLARKLIRKEPPAYGAMPCMGLLDLDEFTPEFERRGIRTRFVETVL